MPTPLRTINDLEPTDGSNYMVKSVNLTVPYKAHSTCEKSVLSAEYTVLLE